MADRKTAVRPGTKELVIRLAPNTKFGDIVAYLEQALVVPEIDGVRGCKPCYSGLDRLLIESTVLPQV